jgi:hypothetical protein
MPARIRAPPAAWNAEIGSPRKAQAKMAAAGASTKTTREEKAAGR